MRPPKTFTLSAKTWTIALDDRLDDDGEAGNHHGYKCAITYSPIIPEQQLRDVILHECFHALMYENGLAWELKDAPENVTEEMVVRRMATSCLALLRANPKLVDFLMEK